jgi:hypothetical protein
MQKCEIFIYTFLNTYIIQFIYVSQNTCLHKSIWKYVFLGDIKLYISNNHSNLNVALTFMRIDSCKENTFYLEIPSLVTSIELHHDQGSFSLMLPALSLTLQFKWIFRAKQQPFEEDSSGWNGLEKLHSNESSVSIQAWDILISCSRQTMFYGTNQKGCLRMKCWGECLHLRGRKCGENYIVRGFIICILYHIIRMIKSGVCDGQGM